MLALLLLAAAACGDAGLTVHLAVTDPAEWKGFGPPPRFTRCDDCRSVQYALWGTPQEIQIDPEPLLRVDGEHVSRAVITVETNPLDLDTRYYVLSLEPSQGLRADMARAAMEHRNERFVVLCDSEVIQESRVGPLWKRFLRAGVFRSEEEASALASRLGLSPEIIPFDESYDERGRIQFLRVMLGEYAGEPHPKQLIEERDPRLFDFLNQHPKYWALLDEEIRLHEENVERIKELENPSIENADR